MGYGVRSSSEVDVAFVVVVFSGQIDRREARRSLIMFEL